MLNNCQKGATARGSDAVQNQWMIQSAEFVLSYIKPKCYWGENAPGLFDNPGKELVDKLRAIGEKYNYTLSLVKTNSELHGLPQRRMRTFYFFWKSPTVPMLRWKETKTKPLLEYLQEIPPWATLQDVYVNEGRASERYRPYQYVLLREGMTHAEFYKKYGRGTVAKYLEKHGLIDDCIKWLQMYYPDATFSLSGGKSKTHIENLEHMKNKLGMNLGYWDDSVKFMGNSFTAVISKNIEFAVHPTEDRFFSVRELLHLMGMPHDYQIDQKKNINHICQNVPVNTAKDWADEVVRFCEGRSEMTNFTFLKQDNISKSVVESFPPQYPSQNRKPQGVKRELESNDNQSYTEGIKEEIKAEVKAEVGCEIEKPFSAWKPDFYSSVLKTEVIDEPVIENHPTKNEYNASKKSKISFQEYVELEVKVEHELKPQYDCITCGFKESSMDDMVIHWDENCNIESKCEGSRKLSRGIMLQNIKDLLED